MPKESTRNTLVRQWEMLKLIPSRGSGITAKELTDELSDIGFTVTKRQIERDLQQLQESFPLHCNDKGKPYGWRWVEGSSAGIPSVTLSEALSLHLIEETIRPLLPRTVLKSLEPRLQQARHKLKSQYGIAPLAAWTDKVRTYTPAMPLLPPEIDADILDTVQTSLLKEQQLDVLYISMQDEIPKSLVLNPHALVQRGAVSYLVATAYDYKDIRLYALHRITSAENLYIKAKLSNDFNLDEYLSAGFMQFGSGKALKVVAIVDEWLARILSETPLSTDQTITPEDEYYRVSATVIDSWQLDWWILSQSDAIEILKPAALRNKIAHKLLEASSQYQP